MLEIKTTKKGAELTSVLFNREEKLHNGQAFWNRHSPVLFPIVGKLKNGKTQIDGKIYEMGQHGFARDMDFEKLLDNSYVLKSNNETLGKFPFKFELYVSYEINENTVTTKYKICNKDSKNMYFGLGGHPAFKCDYSNNDCYIEFEEKEENIEFYRLSDGLLNLQKLDADLFMKDNKIFLYKDIFKSDALIMKNIKSDKVILKENNVEKLEFEFKDFKYLAIWSKENAPFICIEPWQNTADTIDSNGNFEEKSDIIILKPNEEFVCEYSFKFI